MNYSKKRSRSSTSDSKRYKVQAKIPRYSDESTMHPNLSSESDSNDSGNTESIGRIEHRSFEQVYQSSPEDNQQNYDDSCQHVNSYEQKSDEDVEVRDSLDSAFVSDSFAGDEDEDVDRLQSFGMPSFNTFGEQPKRRKEEAPKENIGYINPTVQRMMSKMDYKGKGLGKHEQGVQQPIEASKQKGRRGLGFEFLELSEAVKKFRPEDEIVEVAESVEWLENRESRMLQYEDLQTWMTMGKRKMTIDDEIHFCDPAVLKGVLNSKSVFDRLDKHEMRHARTRSNPFETIRNGFFQNRAALKMANIDRMCNFMFTQPQNIQKNELVYFADVCAGPGGFSEYVLWRRRLKVKGFGFTLRRMNDFKLEDFLAGPTENFHTYYGPYNELERQGDVFLPQNQDALREVVMEQTDDLGVHFMMADGGFSVEGQENIQEILSKQLYLCQCLVALMIVREGGHFVTKLFDIFTPFSAGLVYLMYRAFDSVSIIKPNTSRPANSERYLVCRGKRADTHAIEQYLYHVNEILLHNQSNDDIIELVPMEILKGDQGFYDYLKNSNDELGRRQITGLVKIACFAEDKSMIEPRQAEMRLQCLHHWQIPHNIKRMDFKSPSMDEFMHEYHFLRELANKPVTMISNQNVLKCPYSYYYTVLQYHPKTTSPEMAPALYVSLGGSRVYRLQNNNWTKVEEILLPRKTVVYAELVYEYDKEGSCQMKKKALHIIDAYMIDGVVLNNYSLKERHEKVRSTCRALWGIRGNSNIPVRAKTLRSVNKDIRDEFDLRPVVLKGKQQTRYGYVIPRDELSNAADHDAPYFFVPGSMIFFKFTKSSYTRNLSMKQMQLYYFDGHPENTKFEKDMKDRRDHLSDFIETYQGRVLWPWFQQGDLSIQQFMEQIGPKVLI